MECDKQKTDKTIEKLIVFGVLFVIVALVGGWAVMMAAGALHSIWCSVPAIGYWAGVVYAIVLCILLRLAAMVWKGLPQ